MLLDAEMNLMAYSVPLDGGTVLLPCLKVLRIVKPLKRVYKLDALRLCVYM